MAIVKTYTTPSGVTVSISDDVYARASEAERQRRIAVANRKILETIAEANDKRRN